MNLARYHIINVKSRESRHCGIVDAMLCWIVCRMYDWIISKVLGEWADGDGDGDGDMAMAIRPD